MSPKRKSKPAVKDLLSAEMQSAKMRGPLRVTTPFEAEKLTFTIVDNALHVRGPREILEKVARQLRKLGASRETNPYDT